MTSLGSRKGFFGMFAGVTMALGLIAAPQAVLAQTAPVAAPSPAASNVNPPAAPIDQAIAEEGTPAAGEGAPVIATDSEAGQSATGGGYTPMKPTPGIGMPVEGGIGTQAQFSKDGEFAEKMNNYLLLPVIVAISLFVLALLLWVMFRYRAGRNPVPSKTTHHTWLEVVWTIVPALVLLVIAIPSIKLLAKQYEAPPKDAITIKATGYQWYWGYTYPDNGDIEVISYMLNVPGQEKINPAQRYVGTKPWDGPSHLEVDNRMVVPAGVPLRIQTTGADVIHSFAVPSLWFKLDAVPGRLNERLLTIEKPGVYYGQCSELSGAKHGYMPIAVEALPLDQFNAWVVSQGGTVAGAEKPAAAAAAAPAAEAGAVPAAATGDAAAPAAAAPTT